MNAACGEAFVSTNDAIQSFKALSTKYSTIFLQVDSPGGSVTGVEELAKTIRESSSHVIGFTDTCAASGGYWVLAACDEVVATPSALVGSIGVYIPVMKNKENPFASVHYYSAGSKKLFGAPDVELSEAESTYFQESVDSTYELFCTAVATYRNKTVEEIKATEAGVFDGRETVGLLVDRIVNDITEV
jgi:signal peptide peptidase SppA